LATLLHNIARLVVCFCDDALVIRMSWLRVLGRNLCIVCMHVCLGAHTRVCCLCVLGCSFVYEPACVFVCTHVHVSLCTCVRGYTCVYYCQTVCVCHSVHECGVRVCACVYKCIHVRTCCVYTCVYVYVRVCTCMYVGMCVSTL